MSTIEIATLALVYVVGSILCMAAFGRVHKESDSYTSSEDKAAAIMGSLLAWPICLVVCVGIIAYRKAYK